MIKLFIIYIFITSSILHAKDISNDYEYNVAMAYLSGLKGATEEKRIVPECPYERCSGNTKVIVITKKDYKKALEWFNKAIELDNQKAALSAFQMLYKQLDYKNKTPDYYLVELLKKRFGISLKEYYKNIQKYLIVMAKSNNCKANYFLYETYKNGYFQINTNEKLAELYREKAQKNCKENSFFWLITNKNGNR